MNTQTQIAQGLERFTHFLTVVWPLAAIVLAVYIVLTIIAVSIIIFSKKESTTEP